MRTTVEISDNVIAALHALAVRRGYRGFSKVMEEAVLYYLEEEKGRQRKKAALLDMMGSWESEEAEDVRRKLEEIRKNWKD